MNSKLFKSIVPIALGLIVYIFPTPEGLTPMAWQYFSLFVALVAGLILEPVPSAMVGLLGVVVACLLKIGAPIPKTGVINASAAIRWGLSGFSNGTIWLIFSAFMLALGYEKSGLGRRISLLLVKKLGKTSLGLGYAVIFAETILAPFTPSNSARNGGILFPIIRNIPLIYNSTPEHEPRKVGAYLVWVSLLSTCVTSSIFYSSFAPNMLVGSIVEAQGIKLSWMQWFMGLAPVGILLLVASPFLAYIIYPPTMKRANDAPIWAAEELRKMGPLTAREKLMGASAFLALVLWMGASTFKIDPTTSALTVLCIITLFKVIAWEDIIACKPAWSMLLWLGSLVTMADGLKNVGFLPWFAKKSAAALVGYDPMTVLVGLIVIFYLAHYFFASVTSHVTALYALFLTTILAVPGLDPTKSALLLGYSLGFMGILTPYGTGPSPIWYGLGYISAKAFWSLGAIFGLIFLAALIFLGIPWINWITL